MALDSALRRLEASWAAHRRASRWSGRYPWSPPGRFVHDFSVEAGGQDSLLGVAVVIDPVVPWYQEFFDMLLSGCRSAVRRALGRGPLAVVEHLVTYVADWWTWIIVLSFMPWLDWEWLQWVGWCTLYWGLYCAGRALGCDAFDDDDDWTDVDDDNEDGDGGDGDGGGGGSDDGGGERRSGG